MDGKFQKIIKWIKWPEWKRIIVNNSKRVTEFCVRIIKWIWNKCIEWIRWAIFPTIFLALFLILVIAGFNYFNINGQVIKIKEIISAIELKTDVSQYEIIGYLRKMDELKRSVFDSNAITFMVSFVLVSLAGIWMSIESRSRNLIKNAEEAIKRIEVQRNAMHLHSHVLALHVLSINFQIAIDSNNTIILKELGRATHIMANEILINLRKDESILITKEIKKDFNNIFRKIINGFRVEKNNACARKKFSRFINTILNTLKELQTEISKLKEA